VEVFRLTRSKYKDQLNGVGAALQGGRWNSQGIHVVYTSGNRSLAMAEVVVHIALGALPKDYFMLTIYIPDNIPIKHIPESELPHDWHRFPPTRETSKYGDQFILNEKFPVLKVPSAITPGDFNYLINPVHSGFSNIKTLSATPFPFSPRLLRE